MRNAILKNAAAVLFIAVALFVASSASAQSTLSAILGTVKDSSGAIATDVRLTLRNLDENTVATGRSSPEGLFEFLNLRPGRYDVSAEKQGFAAAKSGEILLQARETRRADFTLEIASRTEAIVVTARVPRINTEDGTLTDSLGPDQVLGLPINYRAVDGDPMSLIITIPGITIPGAGTGISISGGLPTQNELSVDGISIMDVRYHILGPIAPSSEMVGEFRVASAGNGAAYSQMGDVAIITKSGTNSWHGSAFWYHQNAAMDAQTYGSIQKQHKIFHTFGGSLSGPVALPRVYDGHNRTFFFADYEGARKPQNVLDQASVPTVPMCQGNLNGLPGGSAVDPGTGAPFPNNAIPVSRISSVAANLLSKYYPKPNLAVASEDNNLRLLMPLNNDSNGYDVRLDQVIGPRQQMSVRWSQKFPRTLMDDFFPLGSDTMTYQSENLVISHIFTPRPNVSNEFHIGFSFASPRLTTPIRGRDAVANLGLQGMDLSNVGNAGGFPYIDFSDGTNFVAVGTGKDELGQSYTIQSSDALSWVHGRHTAQFGAEVRRVKGGGTLTSSSGDDFGSFLFLQSGFSGNAFVDFLLGLPYHSSYTVLGPPVYYASTGYSFFAQDKWKVTEKLTLNFGLRWELHPPMTEQSNNIANFDQATGGLIVPDHSYPLSPAFLAAINACPVATGPGACTKVLTASEVGLPRGLRRTYYGDWDPRLGFAYRPWASEKTVFRGAIGIYSVALLGQVGGALVGQATSYSRGFVNYQGPGLPPLFTFPNVQPAPAPYAPATAGITGVDVSLKDPRSYQWNFTVEHELPWATTLRASYIGIQSSGLPASVNLNQPPAGQTNVSVPYPLWSNLVSIENLWFSSYQGFRTEFTHQFRNGLMFQASYVLSKNIGDAGAVGGGGRYGTILQLPLEGNVGVTDRFDTRYDRGVIGPSRAQRFLLTGLFPLPFGLGRTWGSNWSGIRQGVLGGWELSTVSLVQTGPYQTPHLSGGGPRPDRIGNGNLTDPTPDHYYDESAFVPAAAGGLGNAGAGILEGPGTVAISAGLAKTYAITEKLRFRLEGTFTNLLNHPNFAPPIVLLNNPQFGKLTAVQTGDNGGNRTGQVSARLVF
jgi:hypothetical protein